MHRSAAPFLLARGAALKAWRALRERRLPLSPAAWVRLLRLHYQESVAAAPRSTTRGEPAPVDARPALVALEQAILAEVLSCRRPLAFPRHEHPRVSVLLVLYNRAELTLRCLRSLARVAIPTEIVIVDNASTDDTSRLLALLDGVTIVRHQQNVGFIDAVNRAAQLATGDLLLLLNNDTEVLPGSLENAVGTLEQSPDIGAVVGKLIHPDGRLQEAGSIVWNDGSCQGYGRGEDPLAPQYMFRRDVDFGSGAFLLTPRPAFVENGGFDIRFRPAYYEDVDYGIRLWQSARRVVYEPAAAVVHFEFASSSSSDRAIEMQRERQSILVSKHPRWIADRPSRGTHTMLQARSHVRCSRVLFVEDRVPHEKLGSGYPRSLAMLHTARELGYQVTLYPLLTPNESWEDAYADIPREIELMLGLGEPGLSGFLTERQGFYDAVLVSRPHNMRTVRASFPALFDCPRPVLVYDAEAVFALREVERRRVRRVPVSDAQAEALVAEELALATGCDAILAVSDAERKRFEDYGHTRVFTLGHRAVPAPTPAAFHERANLLFVGAITDDAAPNADSVCWLSDRVMPQLRATLGPDLQLTVVGRNHSARVADLAGPSIVFAGMVDDATPYFAAARVFVAPTRFGAGIPLKVHQAAVLGVPVVCSSLVAAQLGWRDGMELLVADTPEDFAAQCRRLLLDEALWIRVRQAALARVARDCSPDHFRATFAQAMQSRRLNQEGVTATRPAVASSQQGFRDRDVD